MLSSWMMSRALMVATSMGPKEGPWSTYTSASPARWRAANLSRDGLVLPHRAKRENHPMTHVRNFPVDNTSFLVYMGDTPASPRAALVLDRAVAHALRATVRFFISTIPGLNAVRFRPRQGRR